MIAPLQQNKATLDIIEGDGRQDFTLSGRLDSDSVAEIWPKLFGALDPAKSITIKASDINYCDGSGLALFVQLRKQLGRDFQIEGLNSEYRQSVDEFCPDEMCRERAAKKPGSLPVELGGAAVHLGQDIVMMVSYIGQLTVRLGEVVVRPRRLRWADFWLVTERAGIDAVPITLLIGFLIGLIMAFQSAIPMRQFGVDIFVADLVAISMVRELGPLMAAVVMAGRSGSAFAAEIGTMTVNDEISALNTMGVDPVRFLVTSRVLGGIFVAPFLAVFCSFAGLVGGALVMMALGYPLVTYIDHVVSALSLASFFSGVSKSLVFGLLVAAIGCLRGLQTGSGPRAVGISATRAVVSGIVLVAITDALFAVVFYALDI